MASSNHIFLSTEFEVEPSFPFLEEAMPNCLQVPPLLKIMREYLDHDVDDAKVAPSYSSSHLGRFSIFGEDIASYWVAQATVIARDYVLTAAPLKDLALKIKENPKVLLPTIEIEGMRGTLEQLAIILLDHTIEKMISDPEIKTVNEDKGMAEKLRKLRIKFFPKSLDKAIEQAKQAAPLEDKNDYEVRSSKRTQILDYVFTQIKNDKPNVAVIIKGFIDGCKPTLITNNLYYLNLHQFLCEAFGYLGCGTVNNAKHSMQIKRFCFEVIGTIQRELPSRSRKIWMKGFDSCMYGNQTVNRATKKAFLGSDESEILGKHFYYNEFGVAKHYIPQEDIFTGNPPCHHQLKDYLEQLEDQAAEMSNDSSINFCLSM